MPLKLLTLMTSLPPSSLPKDSVMSMFSVLPVPALLARGVSLRHALVSLYKNRSRSMPEGISVKVTITCSKKEPPLSMPVKKK